MRIERVMMVSTLGCWLTAAAALGAGQALGSPSLAQVAGYLAVIGCLVWAVPPLVAAFMLGARRLITAWRQLVSRRE